MAGRIREEHVTKSILKWLMSSGWEIICFDFPQSGTGKALHPDNTLSKTDGTIIPDIVALKENRVVYFENKDRFVLEDFDKVNSIRGSRHYDSAFEELLADCSYDRIYYGIGMPYSDSNYGKAMNEINKVDFIVFMKEDGSIFAEEITNNVF